LSDASRHCDQSAVGIPNEVFAVAFPEGVPEQVPQGLAEWFVVRMSGSSL
jgi:hypothetical protein